MFKVLQLMDFYRLLPKYRLQNHPTSKAWDRILNDLLDKHEVIISRDSRFTVTLGGVQVWVGNYPYAYGGPYEHEVLPKVATRMRLQECVLKAIVKGVKV